MNRERAREMNAKHTPGPWTLVKNMSLNMGRPTDNDETGDPFGLMGFVGADKSRVCWFGNAETYDPTEGDEPSEADANLIAASPELLEACERAEWWLTTIEGSEAIRAVLRSAIAKAEGRS